MHKVALAMALAGFATSIMLNAAEPEAASLQSISNPRSGCAFAVENEPEPDDVLISSAIIYALNHQTGQGKCSTYRSFEELEKFVKSSLARCQAKVKNKNMRCHVLTRNRKWVALAKDFADLPEDVVQANRAGRSLHIDKAKTRRSPNALSAMQFNELGEAITSGKLKASQVFSRNRSFKFDEPLNTTAVPRFDVLALTRVGASVSPVTPNPWVYKQRQFVLNQMKKQEASFLVAPVNTIGYGFTREYRTILALKLAKQIEQSTGNPVYDPLLFGRAFDQGLRAIDIADLKALAVQAGASMLVIPYIGHDNGQRLFVRIKVMPLQASDSKSTLREAFAFEAQRTFNESLAITGEIEPLFSSFAKSLVDRLGIDASSVRRSTGNLRPDSEIPSLLDAPEEFAASRKPAGALRTAYDYQWLGALVPEQMEQMRSEFFARAFLAIESSGLDQSSSTSVLQARALAELGSLRAARRLLEERTDPLALAYLAFTKGQVDRMRHHMGQVTGHPERHLLRLDYLRLLEASGASEAMRKQQVKQLTLELPAWSALIKHRLANIGWGEFQTNKSLLRFAGKPTHEGWVTRFLATGPRPEIDLAALEGVGQLRSSGAAACDGSAQYCPAMGFVDLLESTVIEATIRPIDHLVHKKGDFQAGLNYLNAVDRNLKGNVAFEKAVASSHMYIKRNAPDTAAIDVLDRRLKQAQDFLFSGIEFTPDLFHQPSERYGDKAAYESYERAHYQNFPPQYWWARNYSTGGKSDIKERLQRELDYLFYALPSVISNSILIHPTIKAQTLERFGEHYLFVHRMSDILAKAPRNEENTDALLRYSKRLIEMQPDNWLGYRHYGFTLARDRNDYPAAAATFLAYPGFNLQSADSALKVAGSASEVANFYYWRGDIENARKFYSIAAKLPTGSNRFYIANQRLAQFEADNERLEKYALARIERYGDETAVRDLLSWYFVTGNTQQAWNAFAATHNLFEDGQPWLAARVGARRAGMSWNDNLVWLRDPAHNQPSRQPVSFSAIAAAGLALTDRDPPANAARDIAGLEAMAGVIPREYIVMPSAFVKGMIALRAGDHAGAYLLLSEELKRIKGRYANGYEFGDVVLPYVAYAAAKSPELAESVWRKADFQAQLRIEAGLLNGFEWMLTGKGNFDFELAKAFQTGLAGNEKAAVQHLTNAFNYMPETGRRIIDPAYQWAEACEWLYRDTGSEIYRTMALEWARKFQKVMPYLAWPYAIEATYSRNEAAVLRAISFVQYLDPNSLRLSRVPEALRRAAKSSNVQLPWPKG